MTFDAGTLAFTYHPTGHVETITAPNEALSFTFDGPLPLTSAWTGAVSGVVGQTYTADFAVATERVNDVAVSFTYDADGLLTQAGALTLARHPDHGSVTGTTLGGVTDQYDWTGYGEPSRYQAHHPAFGSYPVFDAQYTRDDAGRITQVIETVDTILRVWTYAYDDVGRLMNVRRNGEVAASYTYDSNGNRLTYDGDRGHEEGTYDEQDRLLTYGGASYTYAPNGELATKTVGTQMTRYTYDALGNLRSVEQPDGTLIEYVIDGRNRRVGKKVNGTPVKGWLYADQLRIVAELDGLGAVVSRFVYGSKANVPDYVVRGGVTYRIVSDHLGSPRVVLNAETGEVVQRLDFDPFGVVRQDSNPGWQPFGFAGGLYDQDSGLVRFGARDYDAVTGRWTCKDPVTFYSADTNLFVYVFNNPIGFIDRDGEDAALAVITSPPVTEATIALAVLWDVYQQMKRANVVGTDRYYHCVAHCEASSLGPFGKAVSEAVGIGREILDLPKNILHPNPKKRLSPSESYKDCKADLAANELGRKAPPNKSCKQQCQGLIPAGFTP